MDEVLWTRIEALLDQRRDPLGDTGLARDLADRPHEREVVRRLVARLSLLGESPGPSARRPARVVAWLAGGLLVATVLAVLRPWRGRRVEFHPHPVAGFELKVEHRLADPPRLAREVLAPRKVVAWQHEGDGS